MALTPEEENELAQLETEFGSPQAKSPALTADEQAELSGLEAEFRPQDSSLTADERDELASLEAEIGDEGPSKGDIVKGVGAEVVSGGVGAVAGGILGGAIGTAFGGVGAVPGAMIGTSLGGFAGGFLGSLWAQDIEGQEDVSIGRALGAATVSAIPLGGAAAKGVKGAIKITASMVGRAAGREAVKGAAMGGAEATIRTAVDEGRMPTKEEYAAYVGGGALFGGALGAAMPKAGKSLDKFFGKTAREIDDDIASGVIEYKDLKRITAVEGAEGEKVLRGTVEIVKARAKSEAATALITESPAAALSRRASRKAEVLAKNPDADPSAIGNIERIIEDKGQVSFGTDGDGRVKAGGFGNDQQIEIHLSKEEKIELNRLKRARGTDKSIEQNTKLSEEFGSILRKALEREIYGEGKKRALTPESPAARLKNRLLSIVAPSKVVGKEARNEALALRKRAAASEELGARVDRKIKKQTPEVQAQAADFKAGLIDVIEVKDAGGKLQRHPLTDELMLWREKLGEYQDELAYQIDMEDLAKNNPQKLEEVTELIMGLEKELKGAPKHGSVRRKLASAKKKKTGLEASPKLAAKIRRSRLENNFSSVEYRTFTDSDFVPDVKLRPAAVDEVADGYVRGGLYADTDAGRKLAKVKASEHLDVLEQNSARARKLSPQKGTGGKIDSVIKKKRKVGPAEKAWLGEITETGEQFRGTISRVGRLVAQKKTDRNLTDILVKNGLAVPSDGAPKGMVPLKLRSGDVTNLHVSPEVQASVNSLYMAGASERSSNRMIAGIQDLYSSAVGLSKAVKVLLNPPSYAVQVFGNTMTLATMGTNPFGSAKRGARLAFAEFGGLEHVMSTAGVKERKALLREMNEMTEYGIKGENIMESDMRDSFENGLFSKAIEKPIGFFGKAYSVPDTIGRYIGWKAQQKTLKKIFPHLDDEARRRLAADMINDTYQNYDRTSSVFKRLSRMGIMPQFATFTAEFIRNQYNQARFAKQMLSGTFGAELGIDMSKLTEAGLREMRIEGGKRVAAMATVYGGIAAGIEALNSDGGVTDENEQAIKESLPSWDQHKKLAIRMSEDGKSGSYANVSYIAPQALGMAAWDAAMSDEPLENLAGMVVEEFIGEGSFVNRGLMEAINNRNDRGNKISYSEDDLVKAKELLTHFVKETFRPGISREIDKLKLAARGKGDLSVAQVFARQLGYRVNTFEIAENYKYKMMEHKENADGSARAYKKARDKGEMLPDELEAVYQKANESRRSSMAMISRSNDSLKKTNHTESERIQVMKNAGIGSKDILDILNGVSSDIPRVKIPSASERYEAITGTIAQKRRQIMEIRKTDRALATKLMQNLKREQKADRRGFTEKDDLLRNLDVAERARRIMAHPNPSGYLREMRRKGIATKRVVDLVRLMQRSQ